MIEMLLAVNELNIMMGSKEARDLKVAIREDLKLKGELIYSLEKTLPHCSFCIFVVC